MARAAIRDEQKEPGEVHTDTDKTGNPIKEVLDGLFTLLESLESQNAAVLEFLKDQGIATHEKLAPATLQSLSCYHTAGGNFHVELDSFAEVL